MASDLLNATKGSYGTDASPSALIEGAEGTWIFSAAGNTLTHSSPADTQIDSSQNIYFSPNGVAGPAGAKLSIVGGDTYVGGDLHVTGRVAATSLRATVAATPASPSAAGTKGDIAWDANFFYICVATNQWNRIGMSTSW